MLDAGPAAAPARFAGRAADREFAGVSAAPEVRADVAGAMPADEQSGRGKLGLYLSRGFPFRVYPDNRLSANLGRERAASRRPRHLTE
jgi:hypothetical protein